MIVVVILRMVSGGIFMVSGFLKVTHPYQNFVTVVESYNIVHGEAAILLARTLPWAELVLGLFVVLGLWLRPSLFLLWTMNTVFIAALSSALWRKLPLEDCGCFGGSIVLKPYQVLVMDILLWGIFLALTLLHKKASKRSLDEYFESRLP